MTEPTRAASRRRGVGWWIMRIAGAVVVLLLVLLAVTAVAGAVAKRNLARQYPAPGQLVDVGGYRMHLRCLGEGSPTVLLEAGQADYSVVWAKVQPAVAAFTRVCAYDRAGLGWSEPSPHGRAAQMMVDELHTLLTQAGVQGPLVLVGHSLGGMLVRLYAHTYPADVAGMVLVDSLHEALPERYPGYAGLLQAQIDVFRIYAPIVALGVAALSPTSIPDLGLPAEAAAQNRAILATTNYFAASIAEMRAAVANCAAVAAAGITSLGDIPLVVLTAGLADPMPGLTDAQNQAWRATWLELQSDLVALSPRSSQVMAEQSGHVIQIKQPDLVIEAIRQVIAAAQE